MHQALHLEGVVEELVPAAEREASNSSRRRVMSSTTGG